MDKREASKAYKLEGEKKQRKAEKSLAHYYKMKEHGLCVRCGKRKYTNDTVFCNECKIRHNAEGERYNREIKGCLPLCLMGNGIYCSTCGKPVENKGDKLCKRCYENSLRSIKKANENRPTDNYFAKLNKAFWEIRNAKKRG